MLASRTFNIQCVNPGSLNNVFFGQMVRSIKNLRALYVVHFLILHTGTHFLSKIPTYLSSRIFSHYQNAVWFFEKSPNFLENFKKPWKFIQYLSTRIWWWSHFWKNLTLKFSPLHKNFWKIFKMVIKFLIAQKTKWWITTMEGDFGLDL